MNYLFSMLSTCSTELFSCYPMLCCFMLCAGQTMLRGNVILMCSITFKELVSECLCACVEHIGSTKKLASHLITSDLNRFSPRVSRFRMWFLFLLFTSLPHLLSQLSSPSPLRPPLLLRLIFPPSAVPSSPTPSSLQPEHFSKVLVSLPLRLKLTW
jgi:hypothetical protein